MPDDEEDDPTPVFGAPDGTTETWPPSGARVGSASDGAEGTGEAVRVGSVLGSALGSAGVGTAVADGAVVAGLGVVPSARAGAVLARTAVHARARALRTVRRIESLSFVALLWVLRHRPQ
ncbi:hypothetical protein GCM10022233_44120 [Streptomyces shaanxiensis]|uniref:Uncharacterized protein n=1 Tax=Streptomyces shaanxiensis TaxID=653357 RepID=A0ABP7VDW8_9ACTN